MLRCEQYDCEGYVCDEVAVTVIEGVPVCARHYEDATGEPWVDGDEEDFTDAELEDMVKKEAIQ